MITTLQIGLAVTGGVLLAGLATYNAWQARRSAPRKPQPEPGTGPVAAGAGSTSDAQAGTGMGGRQEPVFGTAASAAPAVDAAQLEPSAAGAATAPSPAQDSPNEHVSAIAERGVPALHVVERKLLLDPLIDALATLELDRGAVVSGQAALAALPATRRVDNKPFAVEGHNRDTQIWEPPQPGQLYDEFQAGVQLANRAGPLNDIGFSEFTLKTQAYAEAINATPHFPDMLEEVARARELDQFASANDARLNFVLRAKNAAWSIGYLQQTAARHGFVPGVLPGRLVLPSSQNGAPPLLSLEFDTQAAMAEDLAQSAIYELLLGLEVTHVPQEEQPFARMCDVAQQLASEMDGTVIDGNGYRIDARAMETIARELDALYARLAERDFAAGSDLARRLFA